MRELHVSADIVVAARQHWRQTKNTSWLRATGYPIASAVADFFASRATANPDGSLSLRSVMGADEHHDNVTDSSFSNAAVIVAAEFASEAARRLGLTPPPSWNELSQRLVVPLAVFPGEGRRAPNLGDGGRPSRAGDHPPFHPELPSKAGDHPPFHPELPRRGGDHPLFHPEFAGCCDGLFVAKQADAPSCCTILC